MNDSPAGPEERVFYVSNDTEIRSFLYPFNQSLGYRLPTHIEDNARIIGMDVLFHHQKFIWATQFNPGGIFYKDNLERSQSKTNVRNIVSIFLLYFNFVLIRKKMCLKIICVLVSYTAPLRLTLNQRVHERLTVWLLSVAVLRLPATPRYFCWLDYRKHLLDRSLPDALV